MTQQEIEFLEGLIHKWCFSCDVTPFHSFAQNEIEEAKEKLKPKTRKVKMLAWFDGIDLYHRADGYVANAGWKRMPGRDFEDEVIE